MSGPKETSEKSIKSDKDSSKPDDVKKSEQVKTNSSTPQLPEPVKVQATQVPSPSTESLTPVVITSSTVEFGVSCTSSEAAKLARAGREPSYAYNVIDPNTSSAVDMSMPSTMPSSMQPNPGFEGKQPSGKQSQQQQPPPPTIVAPPAKESANHDNEDGDDDSLSDPLRKESSELYRDQLEKIAKFAAKSNAAAIARDQVTGVGKTKAKQPLPSGEQSKAPSEYRLVATEDPNMAALFPMPGSWPWIAPVALETIEQNVRTMAERNSGLVHVESEAALIKPTNSEFRLFKDRRLHVARRCSFYFGCFKLRQVLVKVIASGRADDKTRVPSEPRWVRIAKHISHCQTTEPGVASPGPFAQIFEIFCTDTDHTLYVFMEVASHKTLHNRIKHRVPVHIQQARLWSAQLLDGVTFLLNHGIAHRAIRLEHLLLDGADNVRIIAWRRAMLITGLLVTSRQRRIRINNHLPPECFRGGYDPGAVDIWSWGVALCALATFRYPFNIKRERKAEDDWAHFKSRHAASGHPQVMTLLDRLFLSDPEKRATVCAIQQSSFFTGREQPPQPSMSPPPISPTSPTTSPGGESGSTSPMSPDIVSPAPPSAVKSVTNTDGSEQPPNKSKQ